MPDSTEIIVFTEDNPHHERTPASESLSSFTHAARLAGLRVFPIPSEEFSEFGGAHTILDYLPQQENAYGVLVGYIATADRYEELRDAALGKGVLMPQTTAQMLRVTDFSQFYPLIKDLTAESVIVRCDDDLHYAEQEIGFPCFVKGAIKSRKEHGWAACTSNDPADLERKWEFFQTRAYSALNCMIVRKIIPLRHSRTTEGGFPMGREYRCYFTKQDLLAYCYYWTGYDPLTALSSDEEAEMLFAAHAAAERLNVPLLVVDVGQLENGRWTVIELGDPQFCGVPALNALQFWITLRRKWQGAPFAF